MSEANNEALNITDLENMLKIIDYAKNKGIFEWDILPEIALVYNKVKAFTDAAKTASAAETVPQETAVTEGETE